MLGDHTQVCLDWSWMGSWQQCLFKCSHVILMCSQGWDPLGWWVRVQRVDFSRETRTCSNLQFSNWALEAPFRILPTLRAFSLETPGLGSLWCLSNLRKSKQTGQPSALRTRASCFCYSPPPWLQMSSLGYCPKVKGGRKAEEARIIKNNGPYESLISGMHWKLSLYIFFLVIKSSQV